MQTGTPKKLESNLFVLYLARRHFLQFVYG